MTVIPFPTTPADQTARAFHVHAYVVIRIKVAVEADGHRRAMRQADEVVFGNNLAVELLPASCAILDADYAEQVIGYLVGEVGDNTFAHSASYGPDHEPDPAPAAWREAGTSD